MSGKATPILDTIIGGAAALATGGLGWLEVANAPTPEAADLSVRGYATLLTVLFGGLAALWWNQSARPPSDAGTPVCQSQTDGNALNGAAATFTLLSLFCSVFAGSPWRSTGSVLSAVAALLLLAFAGNDIRQAIPITLRQRPRLREIFMLVLVGIAAATLVWHSSS